MSVAVRRAGAAEILPLRHAVLRPGRPLEDARFDHDDVAVHLGAWTDGGDGAARLVGCATVFPDPWAGADDPAAPPAEPAAWRLRGMAVDPTCRRAGVGRRVLAAAVDAARAGGAPLLWAQARTTALEFYAGAGFTIVGEEYVTATGLPHRTIVRGLQPARA